MTDRSLPSDEVWDKMKNDIEVAWDEEDFDEEDDELYQGTTPSNTAPLPTNTKAEQAVFFGEGTQEEYEEHLKEESGWKKFYDNVKKILK